MQLLVCLLAVLVLAGAAQNAQNHARPGSLTVRRLSQPHLNVVLTLQRDPQRHAWSPAQQHQFLLQVETLAERDQCLLSHSHVAQWAIRLKLFCPATMDNRTDTDDVPSLDNLDTLWAQFELHPPVVVANRAVKRPRPSALNWYGGRTGDWLTPGDTMRTAGDFVPDAGNLASEQLELAQQRYKRTPWAARFDAKFVESGAPWGLDRIDTHPRVLDGQYHYDQTASSIDIYVLDTGARTTNLDFGGRAHWLANTVGDAVNTDCVGHGTHCASTAAGTTYGVAKQAQVWAVKVLDCQGNGDVFTIGAGVQAVIEHAAGRTGRRAVASMSLGGDASSSLDAAVAQLVAAGIVTVVAAGNEYSNACLYSPSRLGQNTAVITVGASSQQDQRPSFSNYGDCVNIGAPGVGITAAYFTSDTATATMSGTSMATPHTAGVCALILAQDLELTVIEVKQTLLAWATPAIVSGASAQGGGRNLLYALVVVGGEPDYQSSPSPPPPPVASAGVVAGPLLAMVLLSVLPLLLL